MSSEAITHALNRSAHRKLILGSALRLSSLLLSVAIGIVTSPIVVHTLGDRYYGLWTLASSLVGMFSLMDMGLNSAVSRHVAASLGTGDDDALNRYLNTGFFLFTAIGAAALFLAGCVAIAVAWFIPEIQDAPLLSGVIVIMAAQFAIGLPVNAIGGLLTGSLRYDLTTALNMSIRVLNSTAIVVVLLLGGRLLSMAVTSCLLAMLERSLVYRLATREVPQAKIAWRFASRGAVRELLGYSAYTFIAQIADQLRFRIPAFVVVGQVGVNAVTHYNIATTLVGYFTNTMASCLGIVGPVFSRQQAQGDHAAIRKTFYFTLKVSTAMSCFVAFGMIAWGHPFIERWMGANYLDAYPCLVILTIGYIVGLCQAPCVGLLYGTANHHFFAFTSIVEGVSNLILSIILASYFGMLGVAVGTAVPMFLTKVSLQPLFVCRVLGDRVWHYYRTLARSLAICLLALGGPLLLTYRWGAPTYMQLVLVGAVSAFLYLPVVALLLFTQQERSLIWNAISTRAAGGIQR